MCFDECFWLFISVAPYQGKMSAFSLCCCSLQQYFLDPHIPEAPVFVNSFSCRSSFKPYSVNNAFISVSVSATDDVVKVEVWDVVDKGEWRTKELHMPLSYSEKWLFPFRPPVLILSSLYICHTCGQKHPLPECAGEHCHSAWPLACVQWVALLPYTFVFRLF